MSKFKKGDKVRVKEFDANLMRFFDGFNPKMKKYCGKDMEVYHVDPVFETVFLKGAQMDDERFWAWSPDWLEKILDKPASDNPRDIDAFLDSLLERNRCNKCEQNNSTTIDGNSVDWEGALAQALGNWGNILAEDSSILLEAERILTGERDTDYGDPVENFSRIAEIASLLSGEKLTPETCVTVMIAVKLSRERYKHKRDNLVDLVAYIEILNRILNRK